MDKIEFFLIIFAILFAYTHEYYCQIDPYTGSLEDPIHDLCYVWPMDILTNFTYSIDECQYYKLKEDSLNLVTRWDCLVKKLPIQWTT